MSLTLTYKNELGTVTMQGSGTVSPLKITAIEGLGLVTREYNTAVYSGYDGQETLGSRAAPRSITIALELADRNAAKTIRSVLTVFSCAGTLFIRNEDIDRRIECQQVFLPDVTRILKGEIATFVVQFICDSPFFEDGSNTIVPLYRREKLLSTPFTLPTMLGDITLGATIEIVGMVSVEPIITLYYPVALDSAEYIRVKNETSGAAIMLNYAPYENDTVTIDIKNRKAISSVSGNIIDKLSDDTFLGDFLLVRGANKLTVEMGDMSSGFTIECKYSNLYNEAVIV